MHLLVAITPHGFGHAAQVAPVINVLNSMDADFHLTLYTSLPESLLRGRIDVPFELIGQAPDFGLLMHSALEIDVEKSAQRYADVHKDWQASVQTQADLLKKAAPDLLLADVPYVTLAAARQINIPAVAICSLNWADIYRHYFGRRPEATGILEQMEDAYRSAQGFLRPQPSMDMDFIQRKHDLSPIAFRAVNQRNELNRMLGLKAGQALVLVATGGVDTRFPIEHWPEDSGIHWLVSESWQVRRADVSSLEQTGFHFTELLASSDAVLGKCGYGTVTECVVNRTPLLYIHRPDWPEEGILERWLHKHNAAVKVPLDAAISGQLGEYLEQAGSLQMVECANNGAEQAADYLLNMAAGRVSGDRE